MTAIRQIGICEVGYSARTRAGAAKDAQNRRMRIGYPWVSRSASIHENAVTQGHEVSGEIVQVGEG